MKLFWLKNDPITSADDEWMRYVLRLSLGFIAYMIRLFRNNLFAESMPHNQPYQLDADLHFSIPIWNLHRLDTYTEFR